MTKSPLIGSVTSFPVNTGVGVVGGAFIVVTGLTGLTGLAAGGGAGAGGGVGGKMAPVCFAR